MTPAVHKSSNDFVAIVTFVKPKKLRKTICLPYAGINTEIRVNLNCAMRINFCRYGGESHELCIQIGGKHVEA
jgi:hypothetical protein